DSGIGRAVALAFAREGADVALSHLPPEQSDAERSCRAVEESGRRAERFVADLSDAGACERLITEAVAKLGKLDVLVNNAAFQGKSVERFEELDASRVEHTFRVNILAMFHLVRAALPHLKAGATIINVASIQAYQPNPGILDYASTKG